MNVHQTLLLLGIFLLTSSHVSAFVAPTPNRHYSMSTSSSSSSISPTQSLFGHRKTSSSTAIFSSSLAASDPSNEEDDDPAKVSVGKAIRIKIRKATGFSLTAVRATLRGITGFSLQSVRATLRAASGISLTAIWLSTTAATGLWIRKSMSVVMSLFPAWFRYFLQPFLVLYYAPLVFLRTTTSPASRNRGRYWDDVQTAAARAAIKAEDALKEAAKDDAKKL